MTNHETLIAAATAEDWDQPIPRSEVDQAISSEDLEIGGAAYEIVSEDRRRRWIDPPLSSEALQLLAMSYLGRCIEQDPKGDWCLSRYEAAWEAQRWILDNWEAEERSEQSLAKWKKWMEHLYRIGDGKIRRAVVDGILEHLFEEQDIQQQFKDWSADPQLETGYNEAKLWADTQS